MTQRTIYKRAKSKFDMAKITARIKKRLRKRHKKTVHKNKIRKVWKDIVEIMIVKPLVERGKVQVDRKLSLEIVGERVIDNPRAFRFMTETLVNSKSKTKKLIKTRPGYIYKVEMVDERFKGKLIYTASKEIEKAMQNSLKTTNRYYRILQNVNQ
jgi:stress-induced morphogen